MIQRAIQDLIDQPQWFVIRILLLIIAITLHEFGHAAVAVSCGDPTPRQDGRVTLNPLAHLDPIGTLGMILYTFGWGKPVMVNPSFFRSKWDDVKVSAAGPFMNLLQALVYGLGLRIVLMTHYETQGPLVQILHMGMMINIGLAVFNMIPIGPLDGAAVLRGFLPISIKYEFEKFNRQWGMLVMIGLLLTGYVSIVINPVQDAFTTLILRGIT